MSQNNSSASARQKNPSASARTEAARSSAQQLTTTRKPRGRLLIIALIAVFTVIVAAVAILAVSVTQGLHRSSTAADGAAVVRENSHVLDEASDGAVTLVEFLDFECAACAAFYPYVEQFRADYQGRITFVTRYFPIPAHHNSRTAAVAVEAAAQQGRFEEMYRLMFETQGAWGESRQDRSPVFRTYAERLGLDLAAYDAAVAAPETLARVLQDYDDGVALGVHSTPTFFLDGEKMTIESLEGFRAQLDAALAD